MSEPAPSSHSTQEGVTPVRGQLWIDGDGVRWQVVSVQDGWAYIRRHGYPRSPLIQTNLAWFAEWPPKIARPPMPKPQEGVTPRVPDGVAGLALDAYLAAELSGPGSARKHALERMTAALEAAYPHLLAAFKEALLSDEALEAAEGAQNHFSAFGLRPILEAALASLENDEGADRV